MEDQPDQLKELDLSHLTPTNARNIKSTTNTTKEIEEYLTRDKNIADLKSDGDDMATEVFEIMVHSHSQANQLTKERKEKIYEENKSHIKAYRTDPDDDIDDIVADAVEDIADYVSKKDKKSGHSEKKDKKRDQSENERRSMLMEDNISQLSLKEILDRIRCYCASKQGPCGKDKKKKLTTKDGKELGADLEQYGIDLESEQPCDIKHKKDLIDKEKMRKQLKTSFDLAESKMKSASDLITKSKLKKKSKQEEIAEATKKDRRKRRDSSQASLGRGRSSKDDRSDSSEESESDEDIKRSKGRRKRRDSSQASVGRGKSTRKDRSDSSEESVSDEDVKRSKGRRKRKESSDEDVKRSKGRRKRKESSDDDVRSEKSTRSKQRHRDDDARSEKSATSKHKYRDDDVRSEKSATSKHKYRDDDARSEKSTTSKQRYRDDDARSEKSAISKRGYRDDDERSEKSIRSKHRYRDDDARSEKSGISKQGYRDDDTISEKSFQQKYRDGEERPRTPRKKRHVLSEHEILTKKMDRYGVVQEEDIHETRLKDKDRFENLERRYLDGRESTITAVIREKKSTLETERLGTKFKKTITDVTDDAITFIKFHDIDTQEKTEYVTELDTFINRSTPTSSHSSKSLILIKDETEEVDIEYIKRELFLKSDEARQQLQNLYRTQSESILRQFLSIKNYVIWYVDDLLNDAEEYVQKIIETMERLENTEEEEEDVYEKKDVESMVSDEIAAVGYELHDIDARPPITDVQNVNLRSDVCDRKTVLDKTTVTLEEHEGLMHMAFKQKYGPHKKQDILTMKEEVRTNEQDAQSSVYVRKNYDDAIVTQAFTENVRRQDLTKTYEQIDDYQSSTSLYQPHGVQTVIEKNETEPVRENSYKINENENDGPPRDFNSASRKLGDRSLHFDKDGYPTDVMLDKSLDIETINKLEKIAHNIPQLEQVPSEASEKTDTITHVTQKVHTLTKISTHRALSELHIHQTERGEVLTVTSKKHAVDIKITLMPKQTEQAVIYQDIENLKLTIGDFDVRFGYNLILEFLSRWPLSDSWTFCINYLREESDTTSDYYTYEVQLSKPTAQAPIPKVTVNVYFTIEVSRIFPLKCPVNVTYVFEGTSCKYELDTVLKPEEFLNHIVDSKLELIKQILF